MSSSVFIERSAELPRTATDVITTDSNLVVVYGKNGINFDQEGLKNLIDEKSISSISVIRLTSPTPSMEDEDEAEHLRELERQKENASDDNESDKEDDKVTSLADEDEADEKTDNDHITGDDDDEISYNENDDSTTDEGDSSKTRSKTKKTFKSAKMRKSKKKQKERPQIVGIQVEQFYTADLANHLVKSALKLAGVSSFKRTAETDALLEIIKNDHNYTPFTSPAQMKTKLAADKLEAERQLAQTRKLHPPQTSTSVKQSFNKKRQQQIATKHQQLVRETYKFTPSVKVSVQANRASKNSENDDETINDDDEEINKSESDEVNAEKIVDASNDEDAIANSEESAATDNDRDSDLDFNVNNRSPNKRKIFKKSKRVQQLLHIKQLQQHPVPQKRIQYNRDDVVPIVTTEQQQQSTTIQTPPANKLNKPTIEQKMVKIIPMTMKPPTISTVPTVPKKVIVQPIVDPLSNSISALKQPTAIVSPRRTTFVQATPPPMPIKTSASTTVSNSSNSVSTTSSISLPIVTRSAQILSSPQSTSVKEIIINKSTSAPKGVFTDINKLLSEHTPQTPPTQSATPPPPPTPAAPAALPTTPKTTVLSSTPTTISPSKGFMPLGVETAAKHQLPSQISIQTHQSSSELAAEHDKQLDLIDSIVQDELQKSATAAAIEEQHSSAPLENIPALVKMLESTAEVLDQQKQQQQQHMQNQTQSTIPTTIATTNQLSNFTSRTTAVINDVATGAVNDLDLTNARLLDTPDDDITADFLQHVVELIEDDKQFQEAVEKQVFGEQYNNENIIDPTLLQPVTENVDTNTPADMLHAYQDTHLQPHLTTQPAETCTPPPQATKSIIQQMTISNRVAPIAASTPNRSPAMTPTQLSQVPKQAPAINQKEPIMIVRGNGRVITLPPIEAPTTRRAARRAAGQVYTQSSADLSVSLQYESSMDGSVYSNASTAAHDASISSIPAPPTRKPADNVSVSRSRVGKEQGVTTPTTTKTAKRKSTSTTRRKSAKGANSSKNTDVEASESQEDDDDPKKLWCICRQPHNNRFMICCDVCEDWFHGTCVSITKAMGIEMEQKGTDWTCPQCKKTQEEKRQPRITDLLSLEKKEKPPSPVVVQQDPNELSAEFEFLIGDSSTDFSTATPTPTIIPSSNKATIESKDKTPVADAQSNQCNKAAEQIKKTPGTLNVATSAQKKLYAAIPTPTTAVTPKATNATKPARLTVSTQAKRIGTTPLKSQTAAFPTPITSTPRSLHQQQLKFHKINDANSSINNNNNTSAKSEDSSATTVCIVCKKQARVNSIYCSDECIRKYAQIAIQTQTSAKSPEPILPTPSGGNPMLGVNTPDEKKKKAKGLFEDFLLMADVVPKVERVNVFERRSGRVLVGSNAPTTHNLKKWLQENPTFEVVQPGSKQSFEIERRHKQRQISTTPIITTPTVNKLAQIPIAQQQNPIPTHKMPADAGGTTETRNNTPSKQQVTKPVQQQTQQNQKTETKQPKDKVVKRQQSDSSSTSSKKLDTSTSAHSTEPVRLNVRRTLKEQLLQRIKESQAAAAANNNEGSTASDDIQRTPPPQLTITEVEQFVKSVESEMYNTFNRDTGTKYKAKYRSLMFNIKDRKNQTLFAKICAKEIAPKQLVRMSPDELASQELAKWRENENKHQLEMIKKSELDLLSCAKNYVLKTHKGEEVMEAKSTDCVNLDLTIPVEDVVSVLNSTSDSSDVRDRSQMNAYSTDFDNDDMKHSLTTTTTTAITTTTAGKHKEKDKVREKDEDSEKEKEKEKEKERDRSKHKSSNRDHHKDHHHHHHHRHNDRNRSKKRSRSRSTRSRSHSHDKRRKSTSHREERSHRHHGNRDNRDNKERAHRSREKTRSRERNDRKTEEKETAPEKKLSTTLVEKTVSTINSSSAAHSEKKPTQTAIKQKSLEPFNLIDQILESTKTVEEAANLVVVQPTARETLSKIVSPLTTTTTNDTLLQKSSSQDNYERYKRKNPSIPTLWSGEINMIDVSTFNTMLQPIIGNSLNVGKLLPKQLEVVGRISREMVWDYIAKIKKSPNKEIVIISMLPANETESENYSKLYEYLETRQRLGVISTETPQIRDFYIFPLAAGKQMPAVLRTAERVDFYEDIQRPDVLIGILIRCIGKRTSLTMAAATSNQVPLTPTTISVSMAGTLAAASAPNKLTKRQRFSQSGNSKDDEIDIDAIIQAPIVAKTQRFTVIPADIAKNDADEPYSPGGSSDDDIPMMPLKQSAMLPTQKEELQRKMDELNKQIAKQEMEIAGLLNVEPSRYATSSTSSQVLANISIPPDLSKILASIKASETTPQIIQTTHTPTMVSSQKTATPSDDADEEYNPEDISLSYNTAQQAEKKSGSRLAQLSEAELLSMVPDDMIIKPTTPPQSPDTTTTPTATTPTPAIRFEEPPPPGV